MLEDVRIRGLGVIDDVALTLGPGLTVVTGETGAGKTMVVTALTLLFGARADAERVRSGAGQASVEATLLVPRGGPVALRAVEAGAQLDDVEDLDALEDVDLEELVGSRDAGSEISDAPCARPGLAALTLRRVVSASGRSRAFVGGAAAPVGVLGEIAEHAFALHGQSDQLRLTRPGEQLRALDRFAGLDPEPLRAAFAAWRAAAEAHEQRTARARELEREADLLRHGLGEIDSADPQPGEDGELSQRIRRLASADELRLAARTAHDALVGDAEALEVEGSDARTLLAGAQAALAGVAAEDAELGALGARLGELLADADDIAADLRAYSDELSADPDALSAALERQSVLRALIRRYGADRYGADRYGLDGEHGIAGVLAWAREARERLDSLDTSEAALEQLAKARDGAAADLAALAAEASSMRARAAARLGEAITAEIRELAMPTSVIEARVTRRTAAAATIELDGIRTPIGPEGIDQVELVLRAHEGAPAVSLQRGASGGELSRVMLAVEVVLAGTDPVGTMVFDEVDAGVGGRAATEIGRRLARLARERQVIVVTHLAQVAAFADHHLVIDKQLDGAPAQHRGGDGAGITRSDVRVVSGAQRRAELARMLSGQDTATARRHAGELLSAAQEAATRNH